MFLWRSSLNKENLNREMASCASLNKARRLKKLTKLEGRGNLAHTIERNPLRYLPPVRRLHVGRGIGSGERTEKL